MIKIKVVINMKQVKRLAQKTPVEDYKAVQKAMPSMPFKKKIKSMEQTKVKNIEDIFSKNNKRLPNESIRVKRKGKKSRY